MGKSREYWTVVHGCKLDFKVLSLAIFTVSTLMLFGTAQYASAGGVEVPEVCDRGGPTSLSVSDGDATITWSCDDKDLTEFSFYDVDHLSENEVHLCIESTGDGDFGDCTDDNLDNDLSFFDDFVFAKEKVGDVIHVRYRFSDLELDIFYAVEQISLTVAELTITYEMETCCGDDEEIKFFHTTDADVDASSDDDIIEYDGAGTVTFSDGGVTYEVIATGLEINDDVLDSPLPDFVGICDQDTDPADDECQLDGQPTDGHLTLNPNTTFGPTGPGNWESAFEYDLDVFYLDDTEIEIIERIDLGSVDEVHCEEIFHFYSTTGLVFEGLTIVGGSGERLEGGAECTYFFGSTGIEVSVDISGEFTLFPPGSICDDESSPSSFLETHVSGTLILTDEFGNELVLLHEADLCRFFFLEETPGGTGSVDGGASMGIFAGTFGTVETHRTISTSSSTVTGTIWVEFFTPSLGVSLGISGNGGNEEPPTIGMNMAGTKLIVTCGVAFDGKCFTILSPYHEEFKLYEMMSGTHTISITMYCARGVNTCNYAAIGIMPYSESMANTTWKIELYKDFEGNLTTVTTDPEEFLGTVTVTTQIIGDKFWVVSFTVDFKNKDTDPMKFGVQARDDNYGVRNWELNEGVVFIDSDAYPSIVTEFEEYLEVDSLCLNEDPTYRYSCAFAENRDLATQLAEDTLRQMLNGEYIYK